MRWRIHELDPEYVPGALDRDKHQQALWAFVDAQSGLVAELAGEELLDIIALTDKINTLQKRIGARVHQVAPNCWRCTAALS